MNCPWCDAKPNERPHANPNEWECGSFTRGKRRYQTDGCRVRQADKQIDELEAENAQLGRLRDEALRMCRRAEQQRDEAVKGLHEIRDGCPDWAAKLWWADAAEAAIARVEGEQK